ncbi:MAG: TonB-dependent receptor [Prevotella sp.]|nr:TonB-dependent receptor [Prevotella sp.]
MNARSLLLVAMLLTATATQAQDCPTDSTTTAQDSITWDAQLDGIEVKAQRQLVKTDDDRISYDVAADEEARTLTVMDMLRRIPMVTVDAEDNISVRGNSQFRIYKNGRPDASLSKNAKQILKTMPATMVRRIEVITEPGAREDAEGVGAIINLVMADGSRIGGITGSLTGSYNTLHHTNASTFLMAQLGRAVISVDYGYGGMSHHETHSTYNQERRYDNGHRLTSHSDGTSPGHIHYADVNASYDIDSLNLLSASLSGYFYRLNVQGDIHAEMTDDEGTMRYGYDRHYWMPGYQHHSWDGRMDFQHKTQREGELMTLSYMLSLTRQHTESEDSFSQLVNVPFGYTASYEDKYEHFTEHTVQADWVRPLSKCHRIETGAKYIYRTNNSQTRQDFDEAPRYPSTQSDFRHTTQIAALYADYHLKLGALSARAGLRYEHCYISGHYPDARGTDFERQLNDWVPQLSLKYQLAEAHSLKLGYTASITRPGIQYLNPAVVISPTIIEQGNARLESARHHRLTLTYLYIGPHLTLQVVPAFTAFNGGIGQVSTVEDDVVHSSYGNIERLRRWQLEAYAQWKPLDATTVVFNGFIRHDRLGNPDLQLEQSHWCGFYYASVSQQLPLKLRLSLSIYGQTGREPDGVYGYDHPWNYHTIALQRSFLKDDRLTLRLSAGVPFKKYRHYDSAVTQGQYTGESHQTRMGRNIQLAITYRFGSLKASVKKAERALENNDIVGGISRGGQKP